MNRVDPEIKFQFGTSSPIPEQDALKDVAKRWQRAPLLLVPLRVFRPFSQEFRVIWQGSLLAPETGEYEFLVKTENATKLSINDLRRPLIDALVKSGSDTEYRGLDLSAGRAGLSDSPGVLSIQGDDVVDRARMESSAAGASR